MKEAGSNVVPKVLLPWGGERGRRRSLPVKILNLDPLKWHSQHFGRVALKIVSH
jgi:hypothetical protein